MVLLAFAVAMARAQGAHPIVQEIQGVVRDASGAPVPAAVIELHAWNGSLLASQTSGAAGEFQFSTSERGPFELQVSFLGEQAVLRLEDQNSLNDIVVHLDSLAAPRPSAADGDRVSLNDLQAPSKARSKLDAARRAMNDLQLDKAWKLVGEVIRLAPNWGRGYMYRGVLSLQSQDFVAAKNDLATAVARDPRNSLALTELGKLYSDTGQLDQAELYLQRAESLPPVLWPTHFELANLEIKRGNYQGALTMAEDGISDDPPAPPQIHFLAAEAADNLGQTKVAIAEYRAFLALAPVNVPKLAQAHQIALQRLGELH